MWYPEKIPQQITKLCTSIYYIQIYCLRCQHHALTYICSCSQHLLLYIHYIVLYNSISLNYIILTPPKTISLPYILITCHKRGYMKWNIEYTMNAATKVRWSILYVVWIASCLLFSHHSAWSYTTSSSETNNNEC